jgi:hypothetical protein
MILVIDRSDAYRIGGATYSIPDIIFSYSSHHGTWLSFLAFSISCVFFVVAAIVMR